MTIEDLKSLQSQYGYDDMPLGDFTNRLRKKYGSIDNVKQALKNIDLPSQVSPTEAEPARPTLPTFPPDPTQLGADVRKKVGEAASNYLSGLKSQSENYAGLIDNPNALNTPEGRETAMSAINYSPGSMGMIKPVYHGSPYKFTKFADEKIGTGEGAQAFGYGHYLTESPEVAKTYAMQGGKKSGSLFINKQPVEGNEIYQKISDAMIEANGNRLEALKIIDRDLFGLSNIPVPNVTVRKLIDLNSKAKNILQNAESLEMPIYNYEATINKGKPSSADVFLEWDKPLGKELATQIRQKMDMYGIGGINVDSPKNPIMGREIYESLTARMGQKRASKLLSDMGITGIKYPTGSLSGVKGSDKYNYVVFDPKNITIDAINDEPIGLLDKSINKYTGG